LHPRCGEGRVEGILTAHTVSPYGAGGVEVSDGDPGGAGVGGLTVNEPPEPARTDTSASHPGEGDAASFARASPSGRETVAVRSDRVIAEIPSFPNTVFTVPLRTTEEEVTSPVVLIVICDPGTIAAAA
jgi:hypothetical protein